MGIFICVDDTQKPLKPWRDGSWQHPSAKTGRKAAEEQWQHHSAGQGEGEPKRFPHPVFCRGQSKGKNSKRILRLQTSTVQTKQMILQWSGEISTGTHNYFSFLSSPWKSSYLARSLISGRAAGSQGKGTTLKFNLQISDVPNSSNVKYFPYPNYSLQLKSSK